MKIGIIGSGIAGLAAAYRLRGHAEVTLFEANDYLGGHTHTIDVTLPGPAGKAASCGVDTGFLVYNERTYPGLINLFRELAIPTAQSDMSFSLTVPGAGWLGAPALEWNGTNLRGVFVQKRNLLRPRFWSMLREILRFNAVCTELARSSSPGELQQTLDEFLRLHRFSENFRDWYLLPMLGCIWSCPTQHMLRFPIGTLIRFCDNHGLLQVNDRPMWRTVRGGARQYVDKIAASLRDVRLSSPVERLVRDAGGVTLHSQGRAERFDMVISAVHSDQALRMMAQPSALEQSVLNAITYQSNTAVVHIDTTALPVRRGAWAAWNYERSMPSQTEADRVCVHYWINKLQPLPFEQDVIVSLNPIRPISSTCELARFDYAHPVFNIAARRAQAVLPALQGREHTWYCGAWTGYGFHEDGLQSGYAVADSILERIHARRAA